MVQNFHLLKLQHCSIIFFASLYVPLVTSRTNLYKTRYGLSTAFQIVNTTLMNLLTLLQIGQSIVGFVACWDWFLLSKTCCWWRCGCGCGCGCCDCCGCTDCFCCFLQRFSCFFLALAFRITWEFIVMFADPGNFMDHGRREMTQMVPSGHGIVTSNCKKKSYNFSNEILTWRN